MNQRELKKSILDDPNLTNEQKNCKLNKLCEPYVQLSDEELLQLVRDFTETNGREPTQPTCSTAVNSKRGSARGRGCWNRREPGR